MSERTKSVEQVLYEAYRENRGVRLTAEQVDALVCRDDAIRTRINNAAAHEAGVPEPGAEFLVSEESLTWAQLKRELIRENR